MFSTIITIILLLINNYVCAAKTANETEAEAQGAAKTANETEDEVQGAAKTANVTK